MVNSEKLIGAPQRLTMPVRCRINRCRYNRVKPYLTTQLTLCVYTRVSCEGRPLSSNIPVVS
jgi:hypothetical protein